MKITFCPTSWFLLYGMAVIGQLVTWIPNSENHLTWAAAWERISTVWRLSFLLITRTNENPALPLTSDIYHDWLRKLISALLSLIFQAVSVQEKQEEGEKNELELPVDLPVCTSLKGRISAGLTRMHWYQGSTACSDMLPLRCCSLRSAFWRCDFQHLGYC